MFDPAERAAAGLKQQKARNRFFTQESTYDVPDALFFESCVREWAQHDSGDVSISDDKLRNRRYVAVDYARCYIIVGRSYLFEPVITARRLDLDAYGRLCRDAAYERKKGVLDLFPQHMAEHLATSAAFWVLENKQRNRSFFAAIASAFAGYVVNQPPPMGASAFTK